MNCNGIGINLYIVVLFALIFTLSKWCNAMYRIDWNDDKDAVLEVKNIGSSDGYNDYKQQFENQIENNENEILDYMPPRLHNIKDRGKQYTKRSTIENCLYEELKRRVDKFNNDLAKNPNTALKNHIDSLLVDNDKRSTVHECLYEAYKKRLDAISNELTGDGESQYDRTGRSSSVIEHTYKDLARRLQLLSQTLQPDYNIQQSPQYQPPSTVELKRRSTALEPEKSSFDYDYHYCNHNHNRLVEDRDLDNDDDEEAAYEDDNSRLFMEVPLSETSNSVDITASSYPTVLTKAFEANMNPVSKTSPGNLLASVAQKMNTTTLELAQKLTNLTEDDTAAMSHDPNLTATLQKFITRTVGVNTTLMQPTLPKQDVVRNQPNQALLQTNGTNKRQEVRQPKATTSQLVALKGSCDKAPSNSSDECEEETPAKNTTTEQQCNMNPIIENNGEMMNEENTNRITLILEKVLSKLENLEAKKENSSRKSTSSALEGAPCEVLGSWHSLGMGIRFDITLGKATERQLATAEEGNKLLTIVVEECIPPKRKRIVDTDWKFMGSTMQQLGGPFYMYSQRRKDKLLATFTGYCRTCGGIDTVFGSWTFLYPSKDCQDISAAIDNRRDIFRRYKMEVKRKQRFKELLYKNSKMGKTESCKEKD